MKARITIGSIEYLLRRIETEDMDDILKDRRRSSIMGIPVCFDQYRRVWPAPKPDIPDVEFYD